MMEHAKTNVAGKSIYCIRRYWLAFFLLATSVVTQIFTVILFALGTSISRFHFPVAVLITCFLVIYLGKNDLKSLRRKGGLVIAACATFIAAIMLTAQFIDFSYDGQSYHIPAMIALASGWNPFLNPHLIEWNQIFVQESGTELYIDHYPLGSWIMAATVYKLTGLIESGKAFNLIYMFVVYLVAIDFIDRICKCSKFTKYILSSLICLNPIIVCQLGSFYVDGQLAALLTIAIILSVEYVWFEDHRTLALFGLALISLINVKMTGLAYASIIGASTFLGLVFLRRHSGRFASIFSAAWVVAVLVVGFHPYITNTIQYKTPFYPIGAVIKNPLEHQIHRSFLEKSRLEKLAYSLAGRQNDTLSMPVLKSPFVISKSDIWKYASTDVNFGAFGPLFFLVLIELLVVGAFVLIKERKISFFLVFAFLLLLTTMAPISEMWKARYAPQLWLLPIILIIALYNNNQLWVRLAAMAGWAALIVNVALVSYVNLGSSYTRSLDFSKSLALLIKNDYGDKILEIYFPSRIVTHKARLSEYGISYKMVDAPTCANPTNIGFPTELPMKVCKRTIQ